MDPTALRAELDGFSTTLAARIELAFDADAHAVRVAMEPPALVVLRYVGQQVRRLEGEFLPDLHSASSQSNPRYL